MTFFRKPTTLRKIGVVVLAAAVVSAGFVRVMGFDEDAVVIKVDDTDITLGYANFVARYMQAEYDLNWYGYLGEGYWTDENYEDDDGNTWEEATKEDILQMIALQCLLEDNMDEYGVEFSTEDLVAVAEAAEQFMSDNPEETLEELGATSEYVQTFLYYETIATRMEETIMEEADVDVSDEDAAMRTFSYISITVSGTYYDEDYVAYEYTDEEVEENIAAAEEFLAAAKEDYDAAAEEYGYTIYTYSYGSDEESEEDGGFTEEVIEAADDLSEGEVSDIIEVDDRYYVIRLDSEYDEEESAEKKEELIEEAKEEYYAEIVEEYMEAADMKVNNRQWAKVRFDNAFVTLTSEDDEGSSVSE